MKNFHTHTYRCGHATGNVSDYVKSAIHRNITHLGFSDHVPLPDDRWNIRMPYKQLPDYVQDIEEARDSYSEIKIYTGAECDYAPEYINYFKDELLGEYKMDYLMGGVHFIPINGDWINCYHADNSKEFLFAYTDYLIDVIDCDLFAYIAHPDVFAGDTVQQQLQTGIFQELVAAYELFGNFFKERERGLWLSDRGSAPASSRPSYSPPDYSSSGRSASRPAQEDSQAGRGSRQESPYRQSHFFSGGLPGRRLEFGLFLYYQRMIHYRQLIEALIWQRRQRPNLGDIAQRWGWLSDQEVRAILDSRGQLGRFGEKAVRLHYLNERQLQSLLFYQRSQQQRLRQFFIDQNILTAAEIDRLVAEQYAHNQRVAAELFRATR